MKQKTLKLYVCFMLLLSTVMADEFRTFRDTKQREIKAKVTQVSGRTVHLMKEDGTIFEVTITKLSANDQRYVREWGKEEEEPAEEEPIEIDLSKVDEVPSSRIGLFKTSMPPKVVMGLAYIPTLADVPLDEWTYVRENLAGLWFNAAGTGKGDLLRLANSIKTRKYYFISPVSTLDFDEEGNLRDVEFKLNFYNNFESIAVDPSLVLVNDYISKQGKDPARYYCDGFFPKAVEYLKRTLTSGKNPFGRRLFITTRNGQFANNVYDKSFNENQPESLKGRAFSTMLYAAQGGGFVYEADFVGMLEHHQERYILAYNRARELGAKLIWLCPRGHEGTAEEYSENMVKAYAWLEKNKLFPDEIVIIHYSRTAAAGEIDYLNMLPMINAQDPSRPAPGSFTGALYWAIKQREAAEK